MSKSASRSGRTGRSSMVIGSGLVVGFLLSFVHWMGHSQSSNSVANALARASTEDVRKAAAARSGVFVMPAESHASTPARRAVRAQAPAAPPPLPFSFLGKITEDGAPVILLYANGRTFKVRALGPLAEGYLVDDIYDDRVIIRDLATGTGQTLRLDAREYAVPGSLRGEYPQD